MNASQSNAVDPTNVVNEADLLRKMEDEHFRLQRQVRGIQAEREHRSLGVHPQFRRQDQLLKTLKQEYISLKKDLKIAGSGLHKKRDIRMKKDLHRALLLSNQTEKLRYNGVTLMQQLDGLLTRNKEYMLTLRKSVTVSMGEMNERRSQSEHRLVSTENKLEVAMLRFNSAQHDNKKIREEIERMLKDRALFNRSWSKMIATLGKGKKFLTDLFESSTLAYDQRDEWVGKLKSVQEKAKMDQLRQLQEMRDIQKTFDHEMKLHQFLAAKGITRVNQKQQEREEQKKNDERQQMQKELEKYHAIIMEILDYTQKQSIDQIIEDFERKEHDNFSVYKLLTEVCVENIFLQKDLQNTRRMIGDRREWNEMREAHMEDRILQLTEELEGQRSRTEAVRNTLQEKEKQLNDTMEKVEEIFKMLDCSLEPYQSQLGDKSPSLNLHQLIMNLITDKINEYIQIVYYGERKKGVMKTTASSASRLKKYTVHPELPHFWTAPAFSLIVTADPCPVCVESRWLSRVSDTVEQPLTKEMALEAIAELNADPSYVKSDRIHALSECRVPRSRLLMATRFMQQ